MTNHDVDVQTIQHHTIVGYLLLNILIVCKNFFFYLIDVPIFALNRKCLSRAMRAIYKFSNSQSVYKSKHFTYLRERSARAGEYASQYQARKSFPGNAVVKLQAVCLYSNLHSSIGMHGIALSFWFLFL